MSLFCPSCGRNLMVPVSAAGKKGRCPSCGYVFELQAPPRPAEPERLPELTPIENNPFGDVEVSDYTLQPLPPQTFASPASAAVAPSSRGLASPEPDAKYRHGFGLEHRGW